MVVEEVGTDSVGEHGGSHVVIVARNPDCGVLSLDGKPRRSSLYQRAGVPSVILDVIESKAAHGPLHLEHVLEREEMRSGCPTRST